jgi:HD-like signal output (HDOD) protein
VNLGSRNYDLTHVAGVGIVAWYCGLQHDLGIVVLQKLFEQLEDDERRTLSVLFDLGISLISAGLIVDILRAWL